MLFPATRITAAQMAILAERLHRRARALQEEQSSCDELREVEAALVRLTTGEYGLCTECGAPVPLIRLGAHPQARRCILCELSETS